MGLETVKEELIRGAKEQESSIIAEARKESSRIMKEAEAKVHEFEQKIELEAKRQIEAAKRQAAASAEMEGKKIQLEAKKQAIEKAFEEARKSLEALDEKKRESCIKSLFGRAGKELEVASVYCNRKDAKFLKGIKTENADILGGIIAENSDRTIRVDYTFETLLESVKESEMHNINKILFG